MKKHPVLLFLVILSGIILFFSLVGTKGFINFSDSIEDNYFILSVAIDKATEKEKTVRLTIISEDFNIDPSSKNNKKLADIVSVEGVTVFDAIRNFSYFIDKKLFWGHLKYIIISEDIAKENILEYLDFFIRDHQIRYDSTILISQNATAESILRLSEKEGKFAPDILDSLFINYDKISISQNIKFSKVIKKLSNVYSDLYLPSVNIIKNNILESSKQNDNFTKDLSENVEENQSSEEKPFINIDKESSQETEDDSPGHAISLDGFAIFDGIKLIRIYIWGYSKRFKLDRR